MIAPMRQLVALTAALQGGWNMSRSCLYLVMLLLLLLPQPLLAQTDTVDFEQFTTGLPNGWTSIQPPVPVGIATFSGGHLLRAVVGLPANQTTVYGTAIFCEGCLSAITIDFSQPVSNVSLQVLNGQTFQVLYTVQDDVAGSTPQVFSLEANCPDLDCLEPGGQMTVTLPSTGITQVMITSNAEQWDFFVDNVQFSASASGVITTFASGLNFPFGVAVDATGNVYVADRHNHKVRKFNSSGVEQPAVAGTGEAGYNGDGISATTAQLDGPRGVAVSNGNLFIADSGSHIVRKVVLSSGMISTVAGIPQKNGVAENGGPATLATLFVPTGVATDAAGNVYIADSMNQQIRKVNAADGTISAVAGVAGVTGSNNGPASCPPEVECTPATLNSPLGVAVTADGTSVYIAEEGNDRIRGVNSDGVFNLLTGLDSPAGVAVAANGTLYIADTDNHRILRFSGESITTVAGNGTEGFSGDGGSPTAAQLNTPVGVAVDSTGRFLYIADLINNRIRKVDFGPPIL